MGMDFVPLAHHLLSGQCVRTATQHCGMLSASILRLCLGLAEKMGAVWCKMCHVIRFVHLKILSMKSSCRNQSQATRGQNTKWLAVAYICTRSMSVRAFPFGRSMENAFESGSIDTSKACVLAYIGSTARVTMAL